LSTGDWKNTEKHRFQEAIMLTNVKSRDIMPLKRITFKIERGNGERTSHFNRAERRKKRSGMRPTVTTGYEKIIGLPCWRLRYGDGWDKTIGNQDEPACKTYDAAAKLKSETYAPAGAGFEYALNATSAHRFSAHRGLFTIGYNTRLSGKAYQSNNLGFVNTKDNV